jgi:hypothetical protein
VVKKFEEVVSKVKTKVFHSVLTISIVIMLVSLVFAQLVSNISEKIDKNHFQTMSEINAIKAQLKGKAQ